MPSEDPQQTRLSVLFGRDEMSRCAWKAEELASMLRHQLAAPLSMDLDPPGGEQTLTKICRDALAEHDGITFGQLFANVNPPLALLEMVKDFAKGQGQDPAERLPRDIASVLYLAAISAALLRCDARVTNLTDAALIKRLRWASDQPWVESNLASFFALAMEHLQR